MRRLHLLVGLVGVVAFLGTGVYMRMHHPDVAEMDAGPRMLYRSRHIYLLLASLINLGLGTYCRPSVPPWRRWLQIAGSCPSLAAPPLLLTAFFLEAPRSDLCRPFTNPAIIGLLAGTLLHAVGGAGPLDNSE